MKQFFTTRGLKFIAGITILGIPLAMLVNHFSPPTIQHVNMAAAKRHIPILRPLLEKDKRFSQIRVEVYSGYDGTLLVAGSVKSEKDFENLKQIIKASRPPVATIYEVFQEDSLHNNTPVSPR